MSRARIKNYIFNFYTAGQESRILFINNFVKARTNILTTQHLGGSKNRDPRIKNLRNANPESRIKFCAAEAKFGLVELG